MPADIARLDVSGRLRSLIGYSLGLAVYTVVVVALYPAFEHSTSLDKLVRSDSTAAALFGITGKISTSGGWLNANIYANFFPLVMLLLTVGYGAASIAGQDEDGTLCLIAALPMRRTTIIVQKMGAMALQAVVLSLAVAICVFVGRSFDLSVTLSGVASISTTVLLMGVDFGILTMAVGAFTGRRATAIGVGAALAAASYLVSSLAPVAPWIRPARFVSLFYWSVGQNQIATGVSIEDYAVLVLVGLCTAAAAVIAFGRLDVR
jgi:beta-exotoxin I transport system permease protein